MEREEYTIYDIARLAAVSPSTVSRVINNHLYTKEETRATGCFGCCSPGSM